MPELPSNGKKKRRSASMMSDYHTSPSSKAFFGPYGASHPVKSSKRRISHRKYSGRDQEESFDENSALIAQDNDSGDSFNEYVAEWNTTGPSVVIDRYGKPFSCAISK